jgi:hypothetical protein
MSNRPKSRESKLQNYVGGGCCIASMTAIGVIFGRSLPAWAPAAFGAAIGYACWLTYRAYRSWRRKISPSK